LEEDGWNCGAGMILFYYRNFSNRFFPPLPPLGLFVFVFVLGLGLEVSGLLVVGGKAAVGTGFYYGGSTARYDTCTVVVWYDNIMMLVD